MTGTYFSSTLQQPSLHLDQHYPVVGLPSDSPELQMCPTALKDLQLWQGWKITLCYVERCWTFTSHKPPPEVFPLPDVQHCRPSQLCTVEPLTQPRLDRPVSARHSMARLVPPIQAHHALVLSDTRKSNEQELGLKLCYLLAQL